MDIPVESDETALEMQVRELRLEIGMARKELSHIQNLIRQLSQDVRNSHRGGASRGGW
jgi:chromosome segregation ATPase